MALLIQQTGLEEYAPGGKARVKVLAIGGPGAGKRLDVDTRIASPDGWRRFGDLNIGDHVIGSDGKPTQVTGIFDEGVGEAYRITFNDGASVIADPEHLWSVYTRKARESGGPAVVLSTQEILDRGIRTEREGRDSRYEIFMPLTAPVQFNQTQSLPVGPYLLGSLLANGSFTDDSCVYLTTNDEESLDRCISENEDAGLVLIERTHRNSTARRWKLANGDALLRSLGVDQLLSGDKRVPPAYMTSAEPIRRELLAGLLDGDGSVGDQRRARFHTTSVKLARDVQELVWSLGGVARIDVQDGGERGIEFSVSIWTPDNPFRLPRKADRYDPQPWFRAIASIEPVEPTLMRCIRVDAPDELYVIEHYIVTHNTRWASYFPAPLYADCERGLASVADRQVPYVNIRHSQDMQDLLAHLKQECNLPLNKRTYETIVIDTIDAYQRKIKDEWMQKNKESAFQGWEAWGYLNARMAALFTRLLNLDMNVVVLAHYKDKVTKDDVTKRETHELMLQLQGETSDTAFNDFDLVGWLGTYWEQGDEGRIQKRGITFQPTPDKPFLKDRLAVTPKWLDIQFDDQDYKRLFDAVQSRIQDLGASKTLGEVPSEVSQFGEVQLVVAPGAVGSGALPEAGKLTYAQMDKPTLNSLVRERGITALVDGTPIKGNTVKGELMAVLQAFDKGELNVDKAAAEPAAAAAPATSPTSGRPEPAQPPAPPVAPVATKEPVANPRRVRAESAEGNVQLDPSTGLIEESEPDAPDAPEEPDQPDLSQALATAQEQLGGQVLAQDEPSPTPEVVDPPAPPQQQATPVAAQTCQVCGKDLAEEDPDFVRLAWIKFRAHLCQEHFQARKNKR